ncbi:MAG TPA: replication-associated recombination protein A [Bdellovibrionota bacterium]|nr:replication-associated recombination protein A [Bdellovibrionota bacterium]
MNTPLAERMRPRTLSEFFGQKHIVGVGKILSKMLAEDKLFSLILWGPPGSGKTTLAHIIAHETKTHFIAISAVTSGVKDLKNIFEEARQLHNTSRQTLLFIDEIHRFNKAQQDALLPHVESGLVTLIGATTENPSFEVISPLLSRCRVLVLHKLTQEYLKQILDRTLKDKEQGLDNKFEIEKEASEFLVEVSDGDSRIMLNTLEVAASLCQQKTLTLTDIQEAIQRKALYYDKNAEEHYNIISAFIKSLRGSNPHAALYWMARMIEAGENPLFITRRLVVFASEDIGNADPLALQVAVSCMQAVDFVGFPEARLNLSQAVTYLATAPKSNASYMAYEEAVGDVRRHGTLPVPLHIRNAPTQLMKDLKYGSDYEYPHDFEGGKVKSEYLPEKLKDKKYYRPKSIGFEKNIIERMKYWEK